MEVGVAKKQGVPLVISAPSGTGKTTLCRMLLERVPGVGYSVSHTTRQPRDGEQDGTDYFFVDGKAFDAMVAADEFLEWAWVHGERYGTSRPRVEKELQSGRDVVFDIDVAGAEAMRKALPESVLVWAMPPDMKTLEQRLRERATDSESVIQKRLDGAVEEVKRASFYTYYLCNNDLDEAYDQLQSVLVAERLRRINQQVMRGEFLVGCP